MSIDPDQPTHADIFREVTRLERALSDSAAHWSRRVHEALDALKEANDNCERLEAERDEARALLDGEQRNHNVTIKRVRDVTAERDHAQQVIQRVAAERDDALVALRTYGCHLSNCHSYPTGAYSDTTCTCGFAESLS